MTFSTGALAAFAAASAQASATALANGDLDLLNSSGAVLATFDLGTPTASGAVTTMAGFPRTATGAAGTVASARYRTSAGADWKTNISVGVSGSGAQVILNALSVTAGQPVIISSANLTHSGTSA